MKKKINSKMLQELSTLRESRNFIKILNYNFLMNFYENCRIIHYFPAQGIESKDFVRIAYRHYLVSLVSCWETFFRDMFVCTHELDEEFIDKIIKNFNLNRTDIEHADFKLSETLSTCFNFQNIKEIESAYRIMWGSDFFNFLCTEKTNVIGMCGKFTRDFSVCGLFHDWREVIDKTFKERHRIVHDANYRPVLNVKYIQHAEALFLLIPQLVAYFVIKRFGLKHFALCSGEIAAPMVFTMQDILADDWAVVEPT